MSIKARNKRLKQLRRKSGGLDPALASRIEALSQGVPQDVLDEMQLQGVAWAIPEWAKLGPEEPSQAKIADLYNRSFEAQIQRLTAYWKGVGRNV
jgi:hypothetical protein